MNHLFFPGFGFGAGFITGRGIGLGIGLRIGASSTTPLGGRRNLREANPEPVGILAGHCDGITYIDPKVYFTDPSTQ